MFPNAPRPSVPRPLSVLLIEDNQDQQQLITHSLRRAAPQVMVQAVATADEALAHLQRCRTDYVDFPQLILLDLHLPDAPTGWQLLDAIRTDYRQLPVIVISHDQQPATVLRAYRAGAHSFMTKPSHLEQWESHFRELINYWQQTVTLPKRPPSW